MSFNKRHENAKMGYQIPKGSKKAALAKQAKKAQKHKEFWVEEEEELYEF